MFKLKVDDLITVRASTGEDHIPSYWTQRRWAITKVSPTKIDVQGYDNYGWRKIAERHFLLKDYAIERCIIEVVDGSSSLTVLRTIHSGKDTK